MGIDDKYINRQRIGEMIARLRVERGLTIQELAELTGIDNSNLGKIEKGKYNVGIDILYKVCKALGVELRIE